MNQVGGFSFHVLRCDMWGTSKSIGLEELGALYIWLLKGMKSAYYSMPTAQSCTIARQLPSGPPISEEWYLAAVELIADRCECGENVKWNSLPR